VTAPVPPETDCRCEHEPQIRMVTRSGAVASGRSAACCSCGGGLASDRRGELVERDRDSMGNRQLDRELVMPSANVLEPGHAR
jgi:hypothetical protein